MRRLPLVPCAAVLGGLLAGCASQQVREVHYYEPTPETAFKREDGLTVGAVKAEAVKTGQPDWSPKAISLISIK